MKNKKLTITIGIPAYNEEANIGILLKKILSQKLTHATIEAIYVVSDASADNTNQIVKRLKDKKISLYINKKRIGQNLSQNVIFKKAKSDIVILFESDSLPKDRGYIEKLLSPLISNPAICMVQGNEEPIQAHTRIGKIIRSQFLIYYRFAIRDKNIVHTLTSGRGGRAFTKKIYTKLKWPRNVPEDVYCLLWMMKHNYLTHFEIDAICLYKAPEKFEDIQKELYKVEAGKQAVQKYFKAEFIDRVYRRPALFRLKCLLFFIYSQPFYFLEYVFIRLRTIQHKKNFSDVMPQTSTTKKLIL